MENFMFIALLVTRLIAESSCSCTDEGFHINPNDQSCETYIFCLHLSGDIFIEKLYRCPNGTLYNPLLKKCDGKFECTTPSTETSLSTTEPKSTFECMAQGKFPDGNDSTCEKYILCLYLPSGRYVMLNYTCPSGSKFNPKFQTCSMKYDCNDITSTTLSSTTRISTTTMAQTDFNCTKQGRFPVEKDGTCRSYHECFYLANGSFIEQVYVCPSVLKFDPKTQSCNAIYQCTSTTINPVSTIGSSSFICPSTGKFPDVNDATCRTFFYCLVLYNGELHSENFSCPGNERFDPRLQTCSTEYKCGNSSLYTTTPSTVAITCVKQGRFSVEEDESCRSYYNCISVTNNDFTQEILLCPDNLKFNPTTQSCTLDYQCVKPSSIATTKHSDIFLCPSIGRYPDDTDINCKRYFYCVQISEEKLAFNTFECPAGEFFDPDLRACSNNYRCSIQATTKLLTEERLTRTFSILTVPPLKINTIIKTNKDFYIGGISTDSPSNTNRINSGITNEISEITNSNTASTYITTKDGNILCESIGNFPEPTDETCRSYILCDFGPDGELQPMKKRCEYNELFDPRLRKCALSYRCNGDSGFSSTGVTIEKHTPTLTPENSNIVLTDATTDTGNHAGRTDDCVIIYDNSASVTISGISTTSYPEQRITQQYTSDKTTHFSNDICESFGRFPIEDKTCKMYYLCLVGPNGNFVSSRFRCTSGESFDPYLRKCSTTYVCDRDTKLRLK